jgi:hypothetical protein
MAKIGFAKLGIKPNNLNTEIIFNEQPVEVRQYLPVEEKLKLIANVLELSHDQNNFSNPIKVDVYTALEIVEKYTNINFTEKQKENPTKLYDLLVGSGLLIKIFETIPQEEYNAIQTGIERTIKSVYKYQNSILGILDTLKTDYSNLDFDASTIQEKLADPENMELLKGILAKLG